MPKPDTNLAKRVRKSRRKKLIKFKQITLRFHVAANRRSKLLAPLISSSDCYKTPHKHIITYFISIDQIICDPS